MGKASAHQDGMKVLVCQRRFPRYDNWSGCIKRSVPIGEEYLPAGSVPNNLHLSQRQARVSPNTLHQWCQGAGGTGRGSQDRLETGTNQGQAETQRPACRRYWQAQSREKKPPATRPTRGKMLKKAPT